MLLLIILFISFIIKSVNCSCNTTNFYPCACCNVINHYCIHNTAEQSSSFFRWRPFTSSNQERKLDTSTYCCIEKNVARMNVKTDNVTLFKQFCKRKSNSIINRILSSCGLTSQQCYAVKNPHVPTLAPVPSRIPGPRILPPSKENQEQPTTTTKIMSSIMYDEDLTDIDSEEEEEESQDLVTVSVWVPEHDKPNNGHSIRRYQSIYFFLFISIINI